MSQENIEVIRRSLDHFNRTSEPAWHLIDPAITFTTRGDIEPSTTYEGIEGFKGLLDRRRLPRPRGRQNLLAELALRVERSPVRDPGRGERGRRGCALIRNQRQWGRHSGLETKFAPYAMVFTLRGGKVVRWRNFPGNNLLETAGLSE
jgi:hypothetical protein